MWLDAWTFVREIRSTNSTYPRTGDVWFWRSFCRDLWRKCVCGFGGAMRECLSMKTTIKIAVTFLAVGILAAGSARAQQSASSGPQQTPAAKDKSTSVKNSSSAPAAKTEPEIAAKSPDALELKTDKDKASYALGMNIGQGLKRQTDNLDPAIVQRGMKDALSGNKMLMTEDEAKSAWTTFQVSMRKKQEQEAQQLADTNKKEGDAFLAENKTKAGVVTLPSGLQYKILAEGTGPKPATTDSVVCNYKGTLLDGTEFDSSAKHGGPATFPVTGVIKGWTEALQLMAVGSKWELFVPADLAYGQRGTGAGIGPNSTLIFEVELVSIKSNDAVQPGVKAAPSGDASGGEKAQPKDPSKDK
jgi:FKBP-type peptidyl-prolyl cis-trans isomerase FklB